jgi:hypothetical protein
MGSSRKLLQVRAAAGERVPAVSMKYRTPARSLYSQVRCRFVANRLAERRAMQVAVPADHAAILAERVDVDRVHRAAARAPVLEHARRSRRSLPPEHRLIVTATSRAMRARLASRAKLFLAQDFLFAAPLREARQRSPSRRRRWPCPSAEAASTRSRNLGLARCVEQARGRGVLACRKRSLSPC